MKKEDLYKRFSHYEALSKDSSTYMQRLTIYKLMEEAGINVPEPADERVKKGRFPFNCDFFISKHPTAKIIKWVPTRSADKKAKFTYKDPSYFLDILTGITFKGVSIDPSNNTLEEQMKHIGAVILRAQGMKLKTQEQNDAIVSMLANEVANIGSSPIEYDDEPFSFSVSMAPPSPEEDVPIKLHVEPEDQDLPF